jgi:hypothetical protein
MFSLDQNAIQDHFISICNAAETGKVTEYGSSEPPTNKSANAEPTNTEVLPHTGFSNLPFISSKTLNKMSPVPHIPAKKLTKEQRATVFTSSKFNGSKQN